MIIILITALCLSTPLNDYLLKNISSQANYFHKKCLGLLPAQTRNFESLAALTCGEKITDQNLNSNLSKTSLIHIFIVSGSHLILLDQFLSILKIPFLLRFLFLGTYSLAVGWQAPAVRALFGILIRPALKLRGSHFPSDLIVLLTGLLTLVLFPSWWSSLSLLMSWCAALALCMPSILKIRTSWGRAFSAQLCIFLFMSAPLWGIGSLHPLSLVYNLFLGPVVAYLLLPLSLVSIPCPPLVGIFDFVMTVFKDLLPRLATPVVSSKNPLPSISFLWMWIFLWHIALHFLRLHLWQGKDSQ